MAHSAELSFPKIELTLLEDLSPPDQQGFLRLVRRRYRATYPDGTQSEPFLYDAVDRNAIDAVVIAAHFAGGGRDAVGVLAQRCYGPRSPCAIAPTLRYRMKRVTATCGSYLLAWWSGVSDRPLASCSAAQRELHEELGFEVGVDALSAARTQHFPGSRLRC